MCRAPIVGIASGCAMRIPFKLFFVGLVGIAALFMIVSVLNRDGTPTSAAPQSVAADPDYGLPPAPSQPKGYQPVEAKTPDLRAGQIISGSEFINEFVVLNRGVNGFDDRQLEFLGEEMWEAVHAMSKDQDSIFGGAGVDEITKFERHWHRLAEANHRNSLQDTQQATDIPATPQ
jgi:hypothetical protein